MHFNKQNLLFFPFTPFLRCIVSSSGRKMIMLLKYRSPEYVSSCLSFKRFKKNKEIIDQNSEWNTPINWWVIFSKICIPKTMVIGMDDSNYGNVQTYLVSRVQRIPKFKFQHSLIEGGNFTHLPKFAIIHTLPHKNPLDWTLELNICEVNQLNPTIILKY